MPCKTCGTPDSSICICKQRQEAPLERRRRSLWTGNLPPETTSDDVLGMFRDNSSDASAVERVATAIEYIDIRKGTFQNGNGFCFVLFSTEVRKELGKEVFKAPDGVQMRGCSWLKAPTGIMNGGSVAILTTTVDTEPLLEFEAYGHPTLLSQLSPLTESQLRARLDHFGQPSVLEKEQEAYSSGGRLAKKAYLCHALAAVYKGKKSCRQVTFHAGVKIREEFIETLLMELRQTNWGRKKKSRNNVDAQFYIVLGKKSSDSKFNYRRNKRLWETCVDLLKEMGVNFQPSSIAISKNFKGSPHTDAKDVTFQYAASLGSGYDSQRGGQLCVESKTGERVFEVDTYNKLAKIDGRFVHWVKEYEEFEEGQGERYSCIFFSVDEAQRTEVGPEVFNAL